jgi:hypothetical protein
VNELAFAFHQTLKTYLVVLVIFIHPSVTFILGDNLSSVLNNDLMRIEAAIRSNTITTILGLDNLDSNSVLAARFPSLLQISKSTVCAPIATSCTIRIITFIKHDSILTIFVTTAFWCAYTLG